MWSLFSAFFLSLLALLKPGWTPTPTEDADMLPYKPKYYEPQTVEDVALAKKALQGSHRGGDMILPKKHLLGNIWKYTINRWTGYPGKGKVPYVIDRSVPKKHHDIILRAMEQYTELTCVKFVPRKREADYINIIKGDDGCWSFIGKQGGEQELSLGDGCYYIGTIVHELGHALGFLHEHQRHDRDNYVTIYKGNITREFHDQFDKMSASDEIIANKFDYNSIMIYGNYAFSKEDMKLVTMVANNGVQLTEPYNKPGLDNSDIDRVNLMYKCKTRKTSENM